MIKTQERERELIELITHAKETDENSVIEYKVKPHSMRFECEFYKDVLALLNSYDRPVEDRWLIYGVDDKTRTPIGFDAMNGDLLDDASYQQKFMKINPHPNIELVKVEGERILGEEGVGKQFAAFYIPNENVGMVYEMAAKITDKEPKPRKTNRVIYDAGMAFVRCGSSTRPLLEDDRTRIRRIGEHKTSISLETLTMTGSGSTIGRVKANAATLTDPVDNLRLLGSWDERNECDKQAIAALCGLPYEQVIRMLKGDLDSSLFAVNKSIWIVQNRISVIESIGAHLTDMALDALASGFGEIIASVDGMYAIPKDQRIAADVIGVCRGCSHAVRKGAASLCAILANNPGLTPNCTKRGVEAFVSKVMDSILSTDNWHVLASSDIALPLLAQASPSTYLSYIKQNLRIQTSIPCFLKQEAAGIVSVKLGWGLVHGIKIAAMKEDCLSQAISTLVQLLPYTDMAKEAIVSILLPWFPQTEASAASRKGMGRFLARQSDAKSWLALLELLPNKTTTTVDVTEPEYLETRGPSKGVSMSEFWEVSREYCRHALEGARGCFDRIINLIGCIDSFKAAGMLADFAAFLRDERPSLKETESYEIWSSLLSYAERCERFADADWASSSDDIQVLRKTIDEMAPTDEYYQALRACSLDDFELAYADNYHIQCETALAQRQSTVEPLYKKDGLEIIDRLISDGAKGRLVGGTLANVPLLGDDEQQLLSFLDSDATNGEQRIDVARSYIWGKFRLSGWAWVDTVPFSEWPSHRIAMFYAALPFSRRCWSDAERLLGDQSFQYWAETPYAWVIDGIDDVSHCVKQLLNVDRAAFALKMMHFSISEENAIDPDVALEAISHVQDGEVDTMTVYHIKKLFSYIEGVAPSNNLCVQELRFAALLGDRPDAFLFTKMSQDYELFAQVIALAYAKRDPNEEPGSSADLNKWAIQYRVLRNWVVVPGYEENGVFNGSLFESWLAGAKAEAAVRGILKDAEYEIGRNLFHAPQTGKGLFIPEVIASFLEASDAALNGFSIEAFNSRGAHFVDKTGNQEDEIADSYERKAVSAEEHGYINLAACLRRIVELYRQEAEENRNDG